MLDQFNRLITRKAFLEQYKKEKLFENGLEEFDDAKYVVLLIHLYIHLIRL
jgi:tubulin gamma